MQAIKQLYQDELITIIRKHLPTCSIILFGSFARGEQTSSSDIDLALDAGHPIPYKTIMSILLDIDETTIPFKIDLVDLQAAPALLKTAIFNEGIIWWKK